ncbi:VOC family protein [Euzebya tangerina]|uniref:VOC family protein n=1 Tax=Euzebya tangerina TaxID=591198 RepID=UPI000E30F36D|nr:VOC family protein [Euzebya tangerina]
MTITHISLATVWVTDQDEAKAFYIDTLGFEEATDMTMGDGYRWVAVRHPDHPELEVTLMVPGPPLTDEHAEAIRRSLASGDNPGLGVSTDNCQQTFEELEAKGVTFVQPPAERPYGVEAVFRDNQGNWCVLVERTEYDGSEFPHA